MKATPKVLASFTGAALLAALLAVSSLWAFKQIETGVQARKDSNALIKRAERILYELAEAETGQRGYALTADDVFLKTYLAVRNGIRDHLRELRPLTLDIAARKHLDLLAPLVDAKLADMSHIIELRRQGDVAATLAAVRSGKGRRLMDSISAEMSGFTAMEEGEMDIHLPGINGTEAMKILLADRSTAHIPVIAISANAMPRDIELALEAGFFNYLTKPIKVKEFMDALGVALKFSQGAALTAAGGAVTREQAC